MIKSMSWYLMDFLFDRTPGVAKALLDTNCILTITKHSEDENYLRLFDKAIDKIKESGVSFRIHDAVSNWMKIIMVMVVL